MKTIILSTLAALTFATPAMADTFTGPRIEVTAGADDVKGGFDTTDITYGAAVGFDKQFGRVVAGVEAGVDNVFDRSDVSASARLGYVVTPSVLMYGKVGYASWKQYKAVGSKEGLRVGGGLEVAVTGPIFTKIEYQYTDFEQNTGKHGGRVGVGIRF